MKIKDGIILVIGSLIIGWAVLHSRPAIKDPLAWGEIAVLDTAEKPKADTTLSVKGKKALFIGDSHTANHSNGWQKQVTLAVGFDADNVAVSGKTTYWMLNMALYKIDDEIDYVFVYGGANDMYTTSITPMEAIENIKGIARMATKRGAKCIVLTGFDPVKCTKTDNPNYANKYAIFQQLLLTENIEGAQVVDTRVVVRSDCWDGLCHMRLSGHQKIADQVIKVCKFKRL